MFRLTLGTLTGLLAALHTLNCKSSVYAANPVSIVTPAQWIALNSSVGGRLYNGYPWAQPCYSFYNGSAQAPDAAACANVQSVYNNDSIGISQNFGAYMNTNWGSCQKKGQGCVLDHTLPQNPLVYAPPANCYQGSVAVKYVRRCQQLFRVSLNSCYHRLMRDHTKTFSPFSPSQIRRESLFISRTPATTTRGVARHQMV